MKLTACNFTIVIFVMILTSCDNTSQPMESVSYAREVAPILQSNCLKCHNKEGEGYKKSGLNMETYASLMTGTKFGPVVVPGSSVSSTLVRLISGKADPAISMPHGGMQLLKEQEIKAITNWIDQGARDN